MNRRLVAALTLMGVAIAAEPVRAQGAVLFTPYSGVYDPILGPVSLATAGGATVTLTSTPDLSYGEGPSRIGRPSAIGTTYEFGTGLAYWKHIVGAYLNSDAGALNFAIDGSFRTNQISAVLNFNPFCFTAGRAPGSEDGSLPAEARPCEVPPADQVVFRAFDEDGNVVAEQYMTPDDASMGEDTGKMFTLTSSEANIKSWEFRGGLIAVTDVNIAPEPSTIVLAASGLLALAGALRRRRRTS